MRGGSLRAQILSGAVLWSIGLFVAAILAAMALDLRFRQYHLLLYGHVVAHTSVLWIAMLVMTAGGVLIVRRGFSTLERLRVRLSGVRSGAESRVAGRYPSEVQPLVDDLNALLDHQDHAVRRAISKAGDLAHGLKTPLAVLTQEADRARAAGHADLADAVDEQVARMRRQIEYHLAHARASASGATSGASASVLDSASGLARTLSRLHAARHLAIEVHAEPSHVVRVQREDLDEMLGNLMDNACKWARSRVSISVLDAADTLTIAVDDDGPGVETSKRDLVLQRGVRADEVAPGSGLGLAIVRDFAELYGGSIALEDSPARGLRARLRLPAVQP